MKNKITAVQLLKETLDTELKLGTKMVVNWDMYLETEKKQIIEAYYHIVDHYNSPYKNAEQYYNKKYKTKLIDEAGIRAVELFETVNPSGLLQEQAFFIAGFQECIKWLDLQNKLK